MVALRSRNLSSWIMIVLCMVLQMARLSITRFKILWMARKSLKRQISFVNSTLMAKLNLFNP